MWVGPSLLFLVTVPSWSVDTFLQLLSLQLPEGSNQLRQMQLRELAMLNGTLREDGIVSILVALFKTLLKAGPCRKSICF